MGLELLKTALQRDEAKALHWSMSLDAWSKDMETRGKKVALFRDYADGNHRANLSTEMQKMLRISAGEDMDRFNANYCHKVIMTEADRLRVEALEADTKEGNKWISQTLAQNRFDALQTDVTESVLRDADTCVMVSWSNAAGRVVLTHEPIWDGTSGMLLVHNPFGGVQLAVKVWNESVNSLGDTVRANIYYPDMVQKWVSRDGSTLQPYQPKGETWPLVWSYQGQPIGVPVIHFRNRGSSFNAWGLSEIENAIPLQDALNRTLTSLVMAAELTAFQVRYIVGAEAPAGLTPGCWLEIAHPPSKDDVFDIGVLETGQVVPYIQAADWLVGQIGKITDTPLPEFMGGDVTSGEALKQREVGLLGKVNRFQVKNGNHWEDLIDLMARVQTAFGSAPPEYTTVSARWKKPELRNDTEVMAHAKQLMDMGFEEEGLRQMAPIFGWDEVKVQQLMLERQAGQARALQGLMGAVPNFESAFASVGMQEAA